MRQAMVAVLAAVGSANLSLGALAQAPQSFPSEKATIAVETVAGELQNPWGLAFLPDGRALVTERGGRLRLVADGRASAPLSGLPHNIAARGQGGLLGIALDPDFSANRHVYLSFAEDRGGGRAGTSVARGTLNAAATGLSDLAILFRQEPAYSGGNHFGSRLVFDRTGALFVTVGDRFNPREEAQNPQNHIGKVIRIAKDGGAAADNPKPPGWQSEIWSIGHRNVQGAALNPLSGELWTAEHGARGGDEINIPRKGKNYGWPVITFGRDYSGAKIGEGTTKAGLEQPIHHWDPSIAPSGMAFYTGEAVPGWKGSVFVGALSGQLLARLELDGDKMVREERLLTGLNERTRDVVMGPGGDLYLLTDSGNGRLIRLKAVPRG